MTVSYVYPHSWYSERVHMLLLGAVHNGDAPLLLHAALARLNYVMEVHVEWFRVMRGIRYEGQNLQIAMKVFGMWWNLEFLPYREN